MKAQVQHSAADFCNFHLRFLAEDETTAHAVPILQRQLRRPDIQTYPKQNHKSTLIASTPMEPSSYYSKFRSASIS